MASNNNPASQQLPDFAKANPNAETLTQSTGAPLAAKTAAMTAGHRGPQLIQDTTYIDEMAHFDRERIPERVVHAKGAGAFGFFEVTHDITKYSKASIFSNVGKNTNLSIRFSTVAGELGSADTVRDPRGFAVKFYTDEGNWDLVGNNTPIFFIRDPTLFPSFIHTQKRNPVTHLKDPNAHWDFVSLMPQTTHQILFLYSDRGIPDGYRHMHGYGSHTFALVNDKGVRTYCKFHIRSNQPIKNLPVDKAAKLASSDPDYAIRDLFNAISKNDFPSWNLQIQVMPENEAHNQDFNPFDVTKVWSHKKFPLLPVGRIVLNKNPNNYFTDVEMAAYSPSNMVPGIEASPDKMLQGRLFSYPDTHRHRLGPNHHMIPVNQCKASKEKNYQRDGLMNVGDNQGGAPNYFPNSFSGPKEKYTANLSNFEVTGQVNQYDTTEDDNFSQPKIFYNQVLKPDEQKRLAENIGNHLAEALPFLQERALANFVQVDEKLANDVKHYMQAAIKLKSNL